jgi:hypothetical protein
LADLEIAILVSLKLTLAGRASLGLLEVVGSGVLEPPIMSRHTFVEPGDDLTTALVHLTIRVRQPGRGPFLIFPGSKPESEQRVVHRQPLSNLFGELRIESKPFGWDLAIAVHANERILRE